MADALNRFCEAKMVCCVNGFGFYDAGASPSLTPLAPKLAQPCLIASTVRHFFALKNTNAGVNP